MKKPIHAPRFAAPVAILLALHLTGVSSVAAYSFAYTVADMRQPPAQSGDTACPQRDHWNAALAGGINRRWSTSLGTNPVTIITQDQSAAGQLNEIESTILQAFGVWTGVSGTVLLPGSFDSIARIADATACSSLDGLNSVCLNQPDPAFTTGVIAFTRVTTADAIGDEAVQNHPPSTFVGEILDADVLVSPDNASITFATPAALAANPQAYDLESILTHELGHFLGFQHSDVWSAAMFPFSPPPGTFLNTRPSVSAPDAPLSDDDRTGLRILYPDPNDATHVGVISGRILPANPLSIAGAPGVTGIFSGQVVAVENATGAVIAATQAGWSCTAAGPPVFDGSFVLQSLPVGAAQFYLIYVEPFTGPEDSADVAGNLAYLCRNAFTDLGWPAQFACTVP
ncbi:MAG TPA: matrixin family metalloprotease, partial [Candidatus Acidoferrum sp.]|nr:matrixin family metalloprotease [Candidatus Acidoferrum sp.]